MRRIRNIEWRRLDVLPMHDGDGWAIWKKKKSKVSCDAMEVNRLIQRWQPQNPWLIGKPGAPRFVPPICVESLRKPIVRAIKHYNLRLIVGFSIPAVLLFIYTLVSFSTEVILLALSFVMIPLMFTFDHVENLSYKKGIMERALFFLWFYTAKPVRVGFLFWVSLGLLIGGLQLFLQYQLGSMDVLFHRYGAMYQDIRNGEFWRLLTGPFLHYSLLHFFINFCLLIMIGTLTGAMLGVVVSAIIFFLGNAAGTFMQLTLGGQVFDNCGGISFGVYTLFGLLITCSAFNRKLLPKGLASMCVFIAISGMISSEIVSQNAATAGHFGGLIFGAVSAVVLLNIQSLSNKRI